MGTFKKTLFKSKFLFCLRATSRVRTNLYRLMNVKRTCMGKKGLGAALRWCSIHTVSSPAVVLSACHAVRLLPPAETITTHRPVFCKVQLFQILLRNCWFSRKSFVFKTLWPNTLGILQSDLYLTFNEYAFNSLEVFWKYRSKVL